MSRLIYADNAATTQMDSVAFEAMKPFLTGEYGNASQPYSFSRRPKKALQDARETIAACIGAAPEEIFFTSGGTESDNWALRLGAQKNRRKGRHIITTAFEHSAILQTCHEMEAEGWEVTYLMPNRQGQISLDDLKAALRPDTVLVSMMLVNNELGCVLPVKEAAALVKAYDKQILFHTDAVQGFLKVPFTPAGLGVDLLSLSGHKIHAPKGIGALYIRQGLPLKPFILGGGQENGLRSGTEPTGQIAAFAVACQTGKAKMAQSLAHMNQLKAYTLERLHAEVPQVEEIISGDAPHILALTLPGYKSEVLVRVMGDKGVCISAGSACHRGKASHVYEVMGLTKPQRDGAFRVSFSDWSTKEDEDCFVQARKQTQEMLFPTMS